MSAAQRHRIARAAQRNWDVSAAEKDVYLVEQVLAHRPATIEGQCRPTSDVLAGPSTRERAARQSNRAQSGYVAKACTQLTCRRSSLCFARVESCQNLPKCGMCIRMHARTGMRAYTEACTVCGTGAPLRRRAPMRTVGLRWVGGSNPRGLAATLTSLALCVSLHSRHLESHRSTRPLPLSTRVTSSPTAPPASPRVPPLQLLSASPQKRAATL